MSDVAMRMEVVADPFKIPVFVVDTDQDMQNKLVFAHEDYPELMQSNKLAGLNKAAAELMQELGITRIVFHALPPTRNE